LDNLSGLIFSNPSAPLANLSPIERGLAILGALTLAPAMLLLAHKVIAPRISAATYCLQQRIADNLQAAARRITPRRAEIFEINADGSRK
jgi:hypothetical protein